MGLFNKKKQEGAEETRRPVNPTNMVLIRLLAVGYVLWILKDLIVGYVQKDPNAPKLWVLILITVGFLVGCGWILWMTLKQFKQLKAEQAAEAEALAAEEAALEEAQEEDWEEDYEETEE